MLEKLKAEVCKANLDLVRKGLVIETWGNASGVDRARGVMVIKPSGVPYDGMKPGHMVVVSLTTGKVVGGKLKPSSDTDTHLELYRAFPKIGGVVHTHSLYATAWAQACRPLPAYGTTQADYWYGNVPCTRKMTAREIKTAYEANTGKVIVETFKNDKLSPDEIGAVLVANHAPFTWGPDTKTAIERAEILEVLARMNWRARTIAPDAPKLEQFLIDKHYLRKHGTKAYYGQT